MGTARSSHYDWTQQQIADVTRMWLAGDSAGTIGQRFGLTRSAILGKVHRLGLDKRKGKPHQSINGSTNSRSRATPFRKSKPTAKLDAHPEALELDPSAALDIDAQPIPESFLGITFFDLNPNHCRYPRTIDDKMFFCGQPRINESSYCLDCHRRCHTRERNVSSEVREQRTFQGARNLRRGSSVNIQAIGEATE